MRSGAELGRFVASRRLARAPMLVLACAVAACQPMTSPSAAPSSPANAGPTAAPMQTPLGSAATPASPAATAAAGALTFQVQTYPVPAGTHPHDVAPASDGGVWYTGQHNATLGWLDPATGAVHEVPLGAGSEPHGVISGPDGAAWVTDPGLDAIVRVAPGTFEVATYPMPASARNTGLNTGVYDVTGLLWFTGARGFVGRPDDETRSFKVLEAPRGAGPYGITVTPSNDIYVASLQGSYLGAVDRDAFTMAVLEPPTKRSGVRRAWSDSKGRIWISEWNAGQVAVYDPAASSWREWRLPGATPMAYAVYVDETDAVWLSDFGSNSILRFDPISERFMTFPSTSTPANVRQLLGRPGEVWGAESAADNLIVVRYGLE